MATLEKTCSGTRQEPLAASVSRRFRHGLSAILLSFAALPAHAIPPPPAQPPLLREARMVVKVRLVEASNGRVSRISELCEVSGMVPVYSDDGDAAGSHTRAIPGCVMPAGWKNLPVRVAGAKAMSRDGVGYATASVDVTPPGAVPLCPDLCGPQPLANSHGEIRVSGNPKSMMFSLTANPVSILNAKPTIWLDADVEIVDRPRVRQSAAEAKP